MEHNLITDLLAIVAVVVDVKKVVDNTVLVDDFM